MRKNIYRAITLLGAVFLAAGIALAFTAQDAWLMYSSGRIWRLSVSVFWA